LLQSCNLVHSLVTRPRGLKLLEAFDAIKLSLYIRIRVHWTFNSLEEVDGRWLYTIAILGSLKSSTVPGLWPISFDEPNPTRSLNGWQPSTDRPPILEWTQRFGFPSALTHTHTHRHTSYESQFPICFYQSTAGFAYGLCGCAISPCGERVSSDRVLNDGTRCSGRTPKWSTRATAELQDTRIIQ
jgi:hypothetical protein